MHHLHIRATGKASILTQARLNQVMPVWLLRVNKLNALQNGAPILVLMVYMTSV